MKRHTTSIVALVATAVALVVILGTVRANAQDVLLDENFDSYSPGGFPIGWDSVYGGAGWQYQVVANDQWVSSPNSFTMLGSPSNSAVVDYDFASPPPDITYSGRVRVAAGAATANIAAMSLWNKEEATWGMYYCQLRFGDTAIWLAATGVAPVHMQSYNREQWYHWKVEYDAVAKTASVWIDDVQVGTDEALSTGSLGYNALALASEHGAKQCWFDDIYIIKPSATPPNLTLDDVEGLDAGGHIPAGSQVKFIIRLSNPTGESIIGFTLGFRIYSPDGALYDPIVLDTMSHGWPDMFDLIPFDITYHSADGYDADTVGTMAVVMVSSGIPAGFDEQVWWIETAADPSSVGKHLCLDSSYYPPSGAWLWATSSGGSIPAWDGPHCFEVVDNQPPVITNNPYSLVFDHCDMALYDFDADDPEGDPYWFEILAGPGTIITETGEWMYQPCLADVEYVHELVVRACDEFGCGTEEICELIFTNIAPVFSSGCDETAYGMVNEIIEHQFMADMVDCDPLTFSILEIVPWPTGPATMDPASGLFSFEPDPIDVGAFTITVEVHDGLDPSACDFYVVVNDTIGFVYFDDDVIESSSGVVSLALENAIPLTGINIPLVFRDSTTFPTLDSVVWMGRLGDASVLEDRYIDISGADGVPPDTLWLSASTWAKNVLPAGDGEFALLYFQSDSTGLVPIDSLYTVEFWDGDLLYYPEFIATELVCLDLDTEKRDVDILLPDDSTVVYGDSVDIWGGFLPAFGDTLLDGSFIQPDSASFWYSYDDIIYNWIGTDTNGDDGWFTTVDSVDEEGDGWAVWMYPNTMLEGWGYLSLLMYFSDTIMGDTNQVYFYPNAPEPEVLSPAFETGIVDDTAVFQIAVPVPLWNTKKGKTRKAVLYYEKGVPEINQHEMHKTGGGVLCAPTAWASCLLYWARYNPQKFGDLSKSTEDPPKTMSEKQVVTELRKLMKTNGNGTKRKKGWAGVKKYLKRRNMLTKFKGGALYRRVRFKEMKKYLEKWKCDVVAEIRSSDYRKGHAVTLNSLKNKRNADGTYNVDFMDPHTGSIIWTKWKDALPYSTVEYSFSGVQVQWKVVSLWLLRPKNPKGKDDEDSTIFEQLTDDTLFTIQLDITGQAYDSIYFFTFTVEDSSGFEFEDYITYYRARPPCVGIRGNVDNDPGDIIDISDLVYLVDYMFNGGPEPPSIEEADVDGSGGIDISDLVYLVDYMFTGGPPPVPCP